MSRPQTPDPRPREGRGGRGHRQRGFTLVEVMIALAIVALAVVPLIILNGTVMRDTVENRNKRIAWVLLSYKMAELEIDPSVLADGASEQGDFREYDEQYSDR